MNPEEQDFESLKKLLSVKRHEQPPPGYFNDLPRQVWKRIEANEGQPTFWERFMTSFALKPAVAYTFGLVVCGTLIVGIGSALKTDEKPVSDVLSGISAGGGPSLPMVPTVGLGQNTQDRLMTGKQEGSSTNPLFNAAPLYPAGTQFNQEIAPASYTPQ